MGVAGQPAGETLLDSRRRGRRAKCCRQRDVWLLFLHLQPQLHPQHPARPGHHQLQHTQHCAASATHHETPLGYPRHQGVPVGTLSGGNFHRGCPDGLRQRRIPPAGVAHTVPVPQFPHPLSAQQLRGIDAFQMGQPIFGTRPCADDSHLQLSAVEPSTRRVQHLLVCLCTGDCLWVDGLAGLCRHCPQSKIFTFGSTRSPTSVHLSPFTCLLPGHPQEECPLCPAGATHGQLQPHRPHSAAPLSQRCRCRYLCRCFPPARRLDHGGLPCQRPPASCVFKTL